MRACGVLGFWLAALLAVPLAAAEAESNFGRVILARSDLIVLGVASAERKRMNTLTRVELTLEQTLHGKTDAREVSVYYSDPALLQADVAVRALFALKAMAEGGYEVVGKPVLVAPGDAEENDKLLVTREFVALEAQKAGDERTRAFWDLIVEHLRLGGYAAQNAVVELMFVARDRAGIIGEAEFERVRAARDEATARHTRQTKDDLRLALQGMVEARVKHLKYRAISREEDAKAKRAAAEGLKDLQREFPRAFTEEDAKLCDAHAADAKEEKLKALLTELAETIRVDVRLYKAEKPGEGAGK